MANVRVPDGTIIELEPENLIGRGRAEGAGPRKIDVGRYQGGRTVSHRHAQIYRVEKEWYLWVEPDARNDTLVDDQTIPRGEKVRLNRETIIKLGEVVLVFHEGREEPAAEPISPLVAAPGAPSSGWPDRLRHGPATEVALADELKRIHPFPGLMIDEGIWADAHDYHRRLAQLHHLAAHGHGIVEGLEVTADSTPAAPGLLVRPGLAIDAQGRLCVLRTPWQVPVPAGRTGQHFVRLRFHEHGVAPQREWSDPDEYTRVVEGVRIDLDPSPATPPMLELARVVLDGPPRDATSPRQPSTGEIDMRHRELLAIRPPPSLAVGQLVLAGPAAPGAPLLHQLGLRFLLREISLTTPYRARWIGAVHPGGHLPRASLLYLAGADAFDPGPAAIAWLRGFLDAGGVILADACAASERADAFIEAVARLAGVLERPLAPVDRGHPMLTARHVFSRASLDGAQPVLLFEKGGIVLSRADLGCTWAGGTEGQPAARELVRATVELGVNVAVYARERQYPLDSVDVALGLDV